MPALPEETQRTPADDGSRGGRTLALSLLLLAGLVTCLLLDSTVAIALKPVRSSGFADVIADTVRRLGMGDVQVAVLLLLLVIGLLRSRRLLSAAGHGLLALAVCSVVVNVIKVLVHRRRPWADPAEAGSWCQQVVLSVHDSGLRSFPSAESACTFAIVTALAAFYPRLRAPLFAIAVCVAVARVLVGAHYLSDIYVGALLGTALGWLVSRRALRRRSLRAETGRALIAMRRSALTSVLVIAAGALLLLSLLGRLDLFSRDEALYGEAAREMVASGDWLTPTVNGQPFYEKPPLYYWLSAASQSLLGQTAFAVRLPAALLALLMIWLVYLTGRRVWGRRAGLLAAAALALSLQIAIIGRMGIMDVPLACLVFLSLLAYERWYQGGRVLAAGALGACMGLAVLIKGMAGLLAPAIIIVHLVALRSRGRLTLGPALLAAAVFSAVAAPWFVVMTVRHGDAFTSVIFVGQQLNRMVTSMQGHSGPIWYYATLILISFFPWVAFLPAGIATAVRDRRSAESVARFWSTLSLAWIAVVLVGFSLIRTKLPGYITPLLPAMALLTGAELSRRLDRSGRAPWIGVLAGSLALALLVSLLPHAGDLARVDPALGAHVKRALFPCAVWAAGCALMAVAAAIALLRRPRVGIALLALGQAVALAAVIAGVMPVASAYLGGGEAELARIAGAELPNSRLALYEVYPEGVAFVVRRPVPIFERTSRNELAAFLMSGDTALIVPLKKQKQWRDLPTVRTWDAGQYRLLEIPRQSPK